MRRLKFTKAGWRGWGPGDVVDVGSGPNDIPPHYAEDFVRNGVGEYLDPAEAAIAEKQTDAAPVAEKAIDASPEDRAIRRSPRAK
jgi:hypothetical protein